MPFGTVIGKGPKAKTGAKPIDSKKLEASTEKMPEVAEKPNVRQESVKTPHSTPPSSTPSSPLLSVLVGPVAMGTVEEIKMPLLS